MARKATCRLITSNVLQPILPVEPKSHALFDPHGIPGQVVIDQSRTDRELQDSFDKLGDSLLSAQDEYLRAKELDDALFGEDYE